MKVKRTEQIYIGKDENTSRLCHLSKNLYNQTNYILRNQIDQMKQWCFMNGYTINAIYSDIASGISFEKRKGFFEMLDEIMNNKVEKVVITYKDRLIRSGFELFSYLFRKYRTEIVVISEVGNEKLDSDEVFEEIVSLLHCYSMKMYSKRRNHSVEVGYEG